MGLIPVVGPMGLISDGWTDGSDLRFCGGWTKGSDLRWLDPAVASPVVGPMGRTCDSAVV